MSGTTDNAKDGKRSAEMEGSHEQLNKDSSVEMALIGKQNGTASRASTPPSSPAADASPNEPISVTTGGSALVTANYDTAQTPATAPASPLEVQAPHPSQAEQPRLFSLWMTPHHILIFRFRGKNYDFDWMNYVLRGFIIGIGMLILRLVIPHHMVANGAVFSPIIIVLFGYIVGNIISSMLRIPALIGMLIAGIIWGNLPFHISAGTPKEVGLTVRNLAFACLLCRAGVNFDWALIRPLAFHFILVAIVPLVGEAFVHAAVAYSLLDHPSFLSATVQGFVVTPIGTGIVIPIVAALRLKGYGVKRGPASMMMITTAADTVLSIWSIGFIIGLSYPKNSLSLAVRAILGPVQFAAGIVFGAIMGVVCVIFFKYYHRRSGRHGTDVVETARTDDEASLTSSISVLTIAAGGIFLFNYLDLDGIGTVGSAAITATISQLWINQGETYRKVRLSKDLAWLWDYSVAPVLFPLAGSAVKLQVIFAGSFFPEALACILTGVAVKIALLVIVMTGTGFELSEKLFVGIAFCAKGTVQAATASLFRLEAQQTLSNVMSTITMSNTTGTNTSSLVAAAAAAAAKASAEADYQAGVKIESAAMLSIVLCALGSGITAKLIAPKMLIKDTDYFARLQGLTEVSVGTSQPPVESTAVAAAPSCNYGKADDHRTDSERAASEGATSGDGDGGSTEEERGSSST